MRFSIAVAAVAALCLIPAGCGFDQAKVRVGKKIERVTNGVPAEGEKLSKYCTAYNPDPSLHNHTITELLDRKQPFILVFGTPSHCTQCQNQLDTVRAYREEYKGAFEVIHIDQYKNDHVYTALNVKGDPWTFLIDGEGVIQGVYPGVTTWDNLKPTIARMLGRTGAEGVA